MKKEIAQDLSEREIITERIKDRAARPRPLLEPLMSFRRNMIPLLPHSLQGASPKWMYIIGNTNPEQIAFPRKNVTKAVNQLFLL